MRLSRASTGKRVAGRYPKKQLQPALIEGFGFFPGVAPLRSWLIAEAEDFLIQIQADRFYMNWRRRDGRYPRFRDHGAAEGLCSRALKEFASFSDFVRDRLGATLVPTRVELQKQDVLERPRHWADWTDLATILPVVNTFAEIRRTERIGFNLRMVEKDELGATTLQIATRMDAEQPVAVQMDFQCSSPLAQGDANFQAAFHAANERLNSMFAGLLTATAWERFDGGRS
jgi:uncharacterized protein (TIGR04255 family)